MRSLALAFFAIVATTSSIGRSQSDRRATERVVLLVEVLERDATPTIPCGVLGPQPRDVTARVIAVEEGAFASDRILLRWPMCSVSSVNPGDRFRIHVRRFVGVADTPVTRFRVRRAEAVATP